MVFEILPVVRSAQVEPDETTATFVDARPHSWKFERVENGVKWIPAAVVQQVRIRPMKDNLILPAQIADQAQDGSIRLKPVVVELLNVRIPMRLFESSSQAADRIRGFEDRNLVSRLTQVKRGGHAAKPGSDDRDFHEFAKKCGPFALIDGIRLSEANDSFLLLSGASRSSAGPRGS